MKTTIKRIKSEEDFFGVYKLFEGKKSIKELKWLFTDPDNEKLYTAFIAKSKENEIIGVIAYQTSTFKQGDTKLIGVTGFTWKVSPEIKGLHGIILLKKIFEFGDFVYSLGGSEDAQKLFHLFKYKSLTRYYKFYKILNLKQYKASLKKESLKKRVGKLVYLLPSYFLILLEE